jgi:CheY-like chemotaxis protein
MLVTMLAERTGGGRALTPDAALIVVVEDDTDTREAFAEFLRGEGFDVLEAANGRAALDIVSASRPDAVVTDLRMPRMDGIQLIRALRTADATRRLPIICVSGDGEYAGEAAAVGCDAFLPKPCDLDRVVEALTRLIATAKENQPRGVSFPFGHSQTASQFLM